MRLDLYSEPSALPEKDKRRLLDILKKIEQAKKGKNNYSTALKRRYQLGVSNSYFQAGIKWLIEKGCLEQQKGGGRRVFLSLSSKGMEALQFLDNYVSSQLEKPELKVNLRLSGGKAAVAHFKTDADNLTELAFLSNDFILNRILEISAALTQFDKDTRLTIDLPRIESRSVINLLTLMWSFYKEIVTGEKRRYHFGPLYVEMHLLNEGNLAKYTGFWKDHLKNHVISAEPNLRILENVEKTPSEEDKGKEASDFDFFPLLPQSINDMLPGMLQQEEARLWVEKRLEENPDWFMPHYFWVKLGFKQQREDNALTSVDDVSPPVFHEVTSARLSGRYGEFDSIFRNAVRRDYDEKTITLLVNLIVTVLDWRKKDFYENWKVVKIAYKRDIDANHIVREIAIILNAALAEYIVHGAPTIDLKLAFKEYLTLKDPEKVVERIRNGDFQLSSENVCVR